MSSRLVGVSLKAHLSLSETVSWLRELRSQLTKPATPMFVCPPLPLLKFAVDTLAATDIQVGSQDVSPFGPGAHTGDVPASMVADLGACYAEVGHAERRKEHGETDADVALKVKRCIEVGLTPVICVGEESAMAGPEAARFTCAQLRRRAAYLPGGTSVVVAYEPEWAIGVTQAADPRGVCHVVAALRDVLDEHGTQATVLYGGSATEGVYAALCDAAHVAREMADGLFIGRAAFRVVRLRAIVDEVAERSVADAC